MNPFYLLEYYKIRKECKKCEKKLVFDMKFLDERISKLADKMYCQNRKNFAEFKGFSYKLGLIATELYDMGGHTPCVLNFAKSIYETEKSPLFITRIKSTQKKGAKALEKVSKSCNVYGEDFHSYKSENTLIEIYNKVIENAPEVMFVYIHQHDILAVSLMHLLKKNTGMKFVFNNHASHFPNLGMSISDVILEGMPSTKKITNEKRHLYNCVVTGLQSKNKEDIKYYSEEEISKKRAELGVKDEELLTVSGGSSYKYFESDRSEHFEMIKRILKQVPNLKHLAITNLSKEQKEITDKIFEGEDDAKKRLIFHPLTSEYDLLFQSSDLFIDSFPISSAMTQIDLMGMKVPSVVKINIENPAHSFHEYMPQGYPYMYEKVEDMENGILYLLGNKSERERIIQNNYDFWLKNYESENVKKKYLEIAENLKNDTDLVNFLEIPFELQMETRLWRNSERVAKWFKIPSIDEETHKNWLESLKKEFPKNIAFMIKHNGEFIGVTYFHTINYEAKSADWGIYIYDENLRGKGIGAKALQKSIDFAFYKLNLEKIFLDVLNTNEKAKKLYMSKGFNYCGEENGFIRMELKKGVVE